MTHIITSREIYKTVAPYLPKNPIIVEAGAFIGHDTLRMAQYWPQANIHAFEPVPELFEKLQEKTKNYSTIVCHNLALSDTTGTATLYVAQKPNNPEKTTQASSLHKPTGRLAHSPITYPHTIEVSITTLDDWAKKNNVDHVDFLWLDMQGHELAALHGVQRLLPSVKAIFTEANFIQGYEGQPLAHEVIAWIEQQGFIEIARTFANETDWFFGEVLFVKE